jgi:competence protein ComEC
MTRRSLGHRAPLLWLVLPMLVGLAAGQAGEVLRAEWLLVGAITAGSVALWQTRRPRVWSGAMVAAMILVCAASYALQRGRLPEWDALPPRDARLGLIIDRVFV